MGNTGTILNTTNGGTNWSAQNGGVINSLNSVFFTDDNTGWAVGQSGIIINTTNGGNNWSAQNSGNNLNILSVYFTNNNTGWVVDQGYSSSNMFKTTNGGKEWTNQFIGTSNSLNSVFFTNGNTGWIVGNNGTILKSNSVITSNQILSAEIPEQFSLSQNFPNPFNPSTKITYSLKSSVPVKLSIYDMLGRNIITLVNDVQGPGTYQVEFNGANFSSGVYLYRLEAGEFIETKSMLMVK